MNQFAKVVQGVRKFSPLLHMIELGLSPTEIKEAVLEVLDPFFQNKQLLVTLVPGLLVPEAVNIVRLQHDPWAFDMFEKCLAVHRAAQKAVGAESIGACVWWEPAIRKGLSEYWSASCLEVPKDNLPIEEFKYEAFRNIGALVESTMQPFLRALLHQIRLRDHAKEPSARLGTMSLGEVVDELMETSGFPDLFAPPPWRVRLNQWRNIAQHHSSYIEEATIVCQYGRGRNVKELRLSRGELLRALHAISYAHLAISMAQNLFLAENVELISNYTSDRSVRPEESVLRFSSAVATQGFEVMDVKLSTEEAAAVLRDVSNVDPYMRRIHAAQLVYPLWIHTERPHLKIIYEEKDGTPRFIATALGEDCQRIAQGELELSTLAKRTQMIDLKTGARFPGHLATE